MPTMTTKPATKRGAQPAPEPAPRVIPDGLRLAAAALIQDPMCEDWVKKQIEFLTQELGNQHIRNDRQDLAGLRFLTEALNVLHRVAGLEDA